MQIFSQPLPLILYLVLVALHFVSPALPPLWEKIVKYANLALHVVLYFVMMLCRISLDEVVLLYLLSLLLYLLAVLLFQRFCKTAQNESKEEKEDAK